jgi:hypothetical protein
MKSELLLAIITALPVPASDLLLPIRVLWFTVIKLLELCRLSLRRTLPITASITLTDVILGVVQEFTE